MRKTGKGSSNRIKRLTFRQNQKVDDAMHKISAYIRDWCLANKIGLVIIGENAGWKQNSNMGKRNNQNFISIPYNKLISQLQYKLSDIGIRVIITEESYTSKVDHICGEYMKHQECYRGKRLKRGFFQSSTGRLLNADVNGAIGIGRKVIGNAFVEKLLDRGDGLSPVRINVF